MSKSNKYLVICSLMVTMFFIPGQATPINQNKESIVFSRQKTTVKKPSFFKVVIKKFSDKIDSIKSNDKHPNHKNGINKDKVSDASKKDSWSKKKKNKAKAKNKDKQDKMLKERKKYKVNQYKHDLVKENRMQEIKELEDKIEKKKHRRATKNSTAKKGDKKENKGKDKKPTKMETPKKINAQKNTNKPKVKWLKVKSRV